MKTDVIIISCMSFLFLAKCWHDLMRYMYHKEHLTTARCIVSDVRHLLQPQFDATGPHEDFPNIAAHLLSRQTMSRVAKE